MKKTIIIGLIVIFLLSSVGLAIGQTLPPETVDQQLSTFAQSLSQTQAAYFAAHGRYAQVLPFAPAPEAVDPTATPEAGQLLLSEKTDSPVLFDVQGEEFTSPIATPTAPVETAPSCPTDQPDCPAIQAPDPQDVVFTVNVYESPEGHGYEVVAEYVDAYGQTWRAVENNGPETWRDSPWQIVDIEQP